MRRLLCLFSGIVLPATILLLNMGATSNGQPQAGQPDNLQSPHQDWPMISQNLSGTRFQFITSINASNVGKLTLAWVFTTGGSVSATPTVDGNAMYFPDWAGNLYAVNRYTGQLIWSHLNYA